MVDHVVWDDPAVQWSSYDSVVIRTTWDYHLRPAEFREWLGVLKEKNIPVWNSVDTITWNMDKHYLLELHQAGISIPKTFFIEKSDIAHLDMGQFMKEQSVTQCVIKPCISASSTDTLRFLSQADVVAQQDKIKHVFRDRDMIVQEYLSEVTSLGEWSLFYFNKVYSHGVLKLPLAGDFKIIPEDGSPIKGATPPESVESMAHRALSYIQSKLLYARVDLIQRENGEVVLMELELIEPSLYLGCSDGAAKTFADAILDTLRLDHVKIN